jgi:hypothetical protein
MSTTREQKLIDYAFELAMRRLHGKSNEEIAAWVAHNLAICGFVTKAQGASWGVLVN